MKNELELRLEAIKIAAKEIPSTIDDKYFDRVEKFADKIVSYVTKNGELEVGDDFMNIISALMPMIQDIMSSEEKDVKPKKGK